MNLSGDSFYEIKIEQSHPPDKGDWGGYMPYNNGIK